MTLANLRGLAVAAAAVTFLQLAAAPAQAQEIQVTIDNFTFSPNELKLKVGDTHTARLVEDLKRTQLVQYAGASGDYNPLHTDEIFTTKVAGYPSVPWE